MGYIFFSPYDPSSSFHAVLEKTIIKTDVCRARRVNVSLFGKSHQAPHSHGSVAVSKNRN